MSEPNVITTENIITVVTGLAAFYAIVDARLSRKKYSEDKQKERELLAREKGAQEEQMKTIVLQLNDAHEKIRLVESGLNSINTTVLRVKDSIDQFTIVLNKVSLFMDDNLRQTTNIDTRLANVEKKLDNE